MAAQSAGDSVFILEDAPALRTVRSPLNDLTHRPYVLHLRHAWVFPLHTLQHPTLPAPARPYRRTNGYLIVTADGTLCVESLSGYTRVPPALTTLGRSEWEAAIEPPTRWLDGDAVLIDPVTRHFGHMLLELPARLWALDLLEGRPVRTLGLHLHAKPGPPSTWPAFLRTFLMSAGLDPDAVRVLLEPTVVESLYVPGRITPYGVGGYSPTYRETMGRIAAALLAEAAPRERPRRIYLSRSRLTDDPRALPAEREQQLEAIFARAGFAIVHPQEHTLAEQAAHVADATVMAGVSGSQLHLVALRTEPGLTLLRIAPEFHAPPWDARIAEDSGTRIIDVIVNQQPSLRPPRWDLSPRDLDRIRTVVDRL